MMSKPHECVHWLSAPTLFLIVALVPEIAPALPSSDENVRAEFALEIHHSDRSRAHPGSAKKRMSAEDSRDRGRRSSPDRSVSVHGHRHSLGDLRDLGDPREVGRGRTRGLNTVHLRLHGFSGPDSVLSGFMNGVSRDPSLRMRARGVVGIDEVRLVDHGALKTPTNPMPEPGGALLFVAGLGAVASWQRSLRRR